jgi:hypothetical protein
MNGMDTVALSVVPGTPGTAERGGGGVAPSGRARWIRARSADGTLPLLVAALVVGVVLPVCLAAAGGGLSIPHNDAWSYSRIAQTFARSGHIRLLGWNRSALFGQFLVLGPAARWLVVQQLLVALLAGAGLLACYDLLVPSVGRRRAAFAALLTAAWPGFGLLATSFMADVPAMAAMLGCLALGRRALRRGSPGLLVASVAAGLAYDTARWRAGRQLVASGVPADDVDAGLEWRGYHSAAGMAPGDDWNFPGTTPCYVVSAVPRAGQRPVRVLAYRTFLVAGTSRLWVYDDRAQSPKTCRV